MNRAKAMLVLSVCLLNCLFLNQSATSATLRPQPKYKSPTCIALSPDGRFAYVTNHTADSLSIIDVTAKKAVKEVVVGKAPTGVAVSPDGKVVFVANTLSHSISFVDPTKAEVVAEVKSGYEPMGLCVTPDGKKLYSANFISDDISVIDVGQRKEVGRIKVGRCPTFLAITPDGKRLLVNNFLSREPATNAGLTAFVSVIDTSTEKVVEEKRSPGTMLMGYGLTIPPDGKYAYVVHHRPNFNITPSQLSQGWVQTHALTIIPLQSSDEAEEEIVTVLMDNVNSGAANPYGIAVSKDGKKLFVSHRGIHKLSVIDLPKLHALIKKSGPQALDTAYFNLGFLWGKGSVIERVDSGGLGPKGVAVSPSNGDVLVANYFSDSVTVLDAKTYEVKAEIAIGAQPKMTIERKGEFLFHSASHCFQHWLSCSSCHPNVRADGVNWDLLNDGMTNPKNAKSLVGSWKTPPVMALGVRANMEVAVEKGFLFIEFHKPTQEEIGAVAAYLRSVPFIPSPWHRNPDGSLDEKAKRGQKVFKKANCNACHRPPLYTNLLMFDVGTHGNRDLDKNKKFDTPTLLEMYRTAPYLHDGRAATLKDVLTTFNKGDRHGVTSNLTEAEIDDLIAFLMSL